MLRGEINQPTSTGFDLTWLESLVRNSAKCALMGRSVPGLTVANLLVQGLLGHSWEEVFPALR
jgi:hypothetical protein